MSVGNTATFDRDQPWSPDFSELRRDACCRHEVQFYARDEYLLDRVIAFIAPALKSGCSAIVVATKAHRDGIARRLEATGVGLSDAVEQGRYVARDAAELLSTFMIDGLPDRDRFMEAVGGTVMRAEAASRLDSAKPSIFGEMVALLWEAGKGDAAIRLEQLWNELSHSQSFNLLCGYPLEGFNREEHRESFARICAEHTVVIPAKNVSCLPNDENETDRLRVIALLQQSELALKTVSQERHQAQVRTDEIQSQNLELLEQVRSRERSEDELRRLTRRLLSSRDEEQRRIARELHENMAQLVVALSLYFGVLHEESDSLSPRVSSAVDRSRAAVQSLLTEVRKLSYLLHPPTLDDVGLSSALREYLERLQDCTFIRVELDIPRGLPRLPRKVEIAIFRIVEEAVTNLRLNSGSPSAKVRLSCSKDEVLVEIHHRGDGIVGDKLLGQKDTAATRLGILGMRERARDLGGAVNIKTDDQGTSIYITLPTGLPSQPSPQNPGISS